MKYCYYHTKLMFLLQNVGFILFGVNTPSSNETTIFSLCLSLSPPCKQSKSETQRKPRCTVLYIVSVPSSHDTPHTFNFDSEIYGLSFLLQGRVGDRGESSGYGSPFFFHRRETVYLPLDQLSVTKQGFKKFPYDFSIVTKKT